MGGAQLGASLAASSGSRRGGAPKSDLPPPAAAAVCVRRQKQPGGIPDRGGTGERGEERQERNTHTLKHVWLPSLQNKSLFGSMRGRWMA